MVCALDSQHWVHYCVNDVYILVNT
jgi:hypothetical protein